MDRDWTEGLSRPEGLVGRQVCVSDLVSPVLVSTIPSLG